MSSRNRDAEGIGPNTNLGHRYLNPFSVENQITPAYENATPTSEADAAIHDNPASVDISGASGTMFDYPQSSPGSHQGLPQGADHPDNQQPDLQGRSPFDPYYNPRIGPDGVDRYEGAGNMSQNLGNWERANPNEDPQRRQRHHLEFLRQEIPERADEYAYNPNTTGNQMPLLGGSRQGWQSPLDRLLMRDPPREFDKYQGGLQFGPGDGTVPNPYPLGLDHRYRFQPGGITVE
jgi:hypothetical protein